MDIIDKLNRQVQKRIREVAALERDIEQRKAKKAVAKECMKILDEVLTFSEAEAEWGLYKGCLRSSLGKVRDYIRRTPKEWLITRAGMEHLYGDKHEAAK